MPTKTPWTLQINISLQKNERLTLIEQLSRNNLVLRRRILNRIGEAMLETIAFSFEREVSAKSGRPWAPLAPSTLTKKLRAGRPIDRLLVDTGALRKSFTYRVYTHTVKVRSSVPYAGFHQSGTSLIKTGRTSNVEETTTLAQIRVTRMVSRPYWGLQASNPFARRMRQIVLEELDAYLSGAQKSTFSRRIVNFSGRHADKSNPLGKLWGTRFQRRGNLIPGG